MSNLPAWSEVTYDLRTSLALIGDLILISKGGSKGNKIAGEFLDTESTDLYSIRIENDASFRESIDLEEFEIYHTIKEVYKFCSSSNFLDWTFDSEGPYGDFTALEIPFNFFLNGIPNENTDAEKVYPSESLKRLFDYYVDKFNFYEAFQNPDMFYQYTFSIPTIANLAGMAETSVRNMAGPSDDKPLRTQIVHNPRKISDRHDTRKTTMFVKALDALEWLVGRRGFDKSKMPANEIARLLKVSTDPASLLKLTREQINSMIAMLAWKNIGQSAKVDKDLGWSEGKFRAWVDCKIDLSTIEITQLARLLGLEADEFARALKSTEASK